MQFYKVSELKKLIFNPQYTVAWFLEGILPLPLKLVTYL